MEASIPKSESQTAAELSDTGFYRQRAELAAHSQTELINVPLERRRRKSPLNPSSSPSSSSGSGSSESSPRSAVGKNGSSPLTSRHTARRVVTRDGVVMGANLDRYSTVRDPEYGEVKGGKKSDSGQEHVMSFMTFGGSEFEMVLRRGFGSPGQGNGGSGSVPANNEREGGSVSSASRSVPRAVLEDFGASPIGEAPPAYDAQGVASPKQDNKFRSGTIGSGIGKTE